MIWDLPTRLFHWSFVICIIGAFLTGREGNLFWHEIFGLAALGLFIFRIIWGFVGHASARFANFVVGPRHIWQYLTDLRHRRDDPYPGHNPLGALSVLALLALMGTLGLTGLWTGDDILYEGPLTFLAPNWAGVAGRWHILLQQLILPLVGLHLAALLAHHFFLRERLVRRMITGGKDDTAAKPTRTRLGLALLAICVGGALSLATLTPNY
ncbi:MAG TPA: cytochrome B [Rhodobiaceae bacterium]|jgi:cytochrome b|nr:cytochrome B [Rhodobiaceae bacterium]